MKPAFMVFILLFSFINASLAQATADSLFIVTYTTGPAWDATKAPGEQAHFKEHSANLGKWRKEGIIKMGARYADKGIIIIEAQSLSKAKELIGNDEGVINKLFNADVQRLGVFYDGCVERKAK